MFEYSYLITFYILFYFIYLTNIFTYNNILNKLIIIQKDNDYKQEMMNDLRKMALDNDTLTSNIVIFFFFINSVIA